MTLPVIRVLIKGWETMMRHLVTRLVVPAVASLAWLGALAIPHAQAGFILDGAANFAVLGQFSNNQTNFNNGTITGDIGIGQTRQFTISNASVVGNIRFSGAVNESGLSGGPIPGPGPYTVSGGGTVSGGVFANDASVTTALNTVNSLSQMLGGEAGTPLTLTSSQTINASAGMLDGSGNEVFQTNSVNLNNASVLTINGSPSDFVVVNVTDSNPAFNGSIVLTGGITSDHVLFNMFGGDYTTHTGGPTLTISTNGQITTGVFLDPNGGMQINHSVLDGRFFGGDVVNQQIVSGADINAPTGPGTPPGVPEPATMLLVLLGAPAIGVLAWRRRQARKSLALA
jgi:PEP-CTERM motif